MRSKVAHLIMYCIILASCSSTPKPVDISHCSSGTMAERYDCVFIAHNEHIEYIYTRHFPDEKIAKGRITLVLSITQDGSVAEVHIGKSTMNIVSFETDLLTYVSKMNFGMGMAQHTIRILDFPMSD